MRNKGGAGGSNVIYPKTKTKTKTQTQTKQSTKNKGKTQMKSGGVKIGDYKFDDKWRCKTCKFLNDIENEECKTCGDPRYPQEKKEEEQE